MGGNTVQFQNAEHGLNWKIEYLESENYVRILGTARKREIMIEDIMSKNCWLICFKWYTKIIHWTHNLKFIFPYSSSNASTMLWASMEKAWWGCSVMPQFTNAFLDALASLESIIWHDWQKFTFFSKSVSHTFSDIQ